jgi:ABC-type cobalamin transport system permease subunit
LELLNPTATNKLELLTVTELTVAGVVLPFISAGVVHPAIYFTDVIKPISA